jgi:hypothetical protein
MSDLASNTRNMCGSQCHAVAEPSLWHRVAHNYKCLGNRDFAALLVVGVAGSQSSRIGVALIAALVAGIRCGGCGGCGVPRRGGLHDRLRLALRRLDGSRLGRLRDLHGFGGSRLDSTHSTIQHRNCEQNRGRVWSKSWKRVINLRGMSEAEDASTPHLPQCNTLTHPSNSLLGFCSNMLKDVSRS